MGRCGDFLERRDLGVGKGRKTSFEICRGSSVMDPQAAASARDGRKHVRRKACIRSTSGASLHLAALRPAGILTLKVLSSEVWEFIGYGCI